MTNIQKVKTLREIDKQAVSISNRFIGRMVQSELIRVADKIDPTLGQFKAKGERSELKLVALSLPTYLDWAEPINLAEAINRKPNRAKAVIEHLGFISAIASTNVEVVLIPPKPHLLEGVYMRDIGVVIGNKLIESNMVAKVRKREESQISGGIKPPQEVQIEGGNVIVEGEIVFLGIGDRTNIEAAKWLQEIVGTEFQIMPIKLRNGVLHLDCALGPIGIPNGKAGGALAYKSAFQEEKDLKLFEKIYGKLNWITKGEYAKMGANGFWVNPETVFVNPDCPRLIEIIKGKGKEVILLPMPEVVLGEGFARCSTMPLIR